MNPLLRPERGFLDHALAGIGCSAAGLAIGFSLNNAPFALFLAGLCAVSTVLGYLIAKGTRNKNVAGLGTGLWIFFSLACFFLVRPLNEALPGQPFEFKTMIGATLSWMLIMCPLVSWRDQSLLFLTLPSLALFGLVGTFDYAPGTWLFFAFLLCAGILYSRVHQRSMLERAALVGEGRIELLRRGAWRWMAGPEWALASGCIIIVLSLIAAPLVQFSVQGVAGRVSVTIPQPPQQPNATVVDTSSSSDTNVGRGPISPTDTPVFRIRLDEPQLLRAESMNRYTGSGWSRRALTIDANSPLVKLWPLRSERDLPYFPWAQNQPPAMPLRDPILMEFEIISLRRLSRGVYRPGPIVGVAQTPNTGYFTPDGMFYIDEGFRRDSRFKGTAAVSTGAFFKNRNEAKAKVWPEFAADLESKDNIHPQVRELAMKLIEGKNSDYEKALALKTYIEQTCKYNLNAEALPPRTNCAAQYFLFESKEGYCDLFATAMTTLARAAGLPSRYTMGYLINDLKLDDNGYYTVRERDYHAWSEIYFEGYGWIPFDATEGAEEIPGAGVGASSDEHIPFFERPWVQETLKVVLFIVLIVPTFIYLIRQGIQSRKFVKTNEIVHLHNGFNRAIEGLAKSPKRFSQTTTEYVAQSAVKLGDLHPEATRIASEFESALYGPEDKRVGRAAELKPVIAAFRKAAKEARRRPS